MQLAHAAGRANMALPCCTATSGGSYTSTTHVITYTYDAANRLTDRGVSDGRVYTYTWSARGQMLAEWTQGYPVRTFTYDGAGQLVEATVFTLTTRFTYNGLGARVAVEVVGQGTTTVTLDYAAGNRILAEETADGTTLYLYGRDCLGELRDDEWLYYLNDGTGLVRQGTDEQGQVEIAWLG
jgi:YD repeat-containing protein